VTVDSKDNVVAAGTISEFGREYFTAAKWELAGNELWGNVKQSDNLIPEPARAVAVDSNDNVIATSDGGGLMQTIKVDAQNTTCVPIRGPEQPEIIRTTLRRYQSSFRLRQAG
jgi:hypothetical protein